MSDRTAAQAQRASRLHVWILATAAALAPACSGGHDAVDGVGDGGVLGDAGAEAGQRAESSAPDAPVTRTNNVVTLNVNQGLPDTGSVDEPFVSVTICIPGTSQCQTIEDVLVDTGSTGVRIMASALATGMTLPAEAATAGGTLVECEEFGGGYQWGSVRLADVMLGGEVARKLPIHVVGDPEFSSVPVECSSSGPPQLSPAELGANGLVGIDTFVADCGSPCTGSDPLTAFYYSCSGGDCTVASAAAAQQVTNPIALFDTDNNGALIRFPAVPPLGAATLTGQLILGIGTAANNGLGSAQILKLDEYGYFTTVFDGQTFSQSFLDTGTNNLLFDDSGIPTCPGELSYLFCPASPLSLMAQNTGQNAVTSTVTFGVEAATTLYATSYTAFDDVGGPGGAGSFVWGFPFFIGRTVYVGLLGATTPGGEGPFFAY